MITPVQIFNLQKNIYPVLKQPKINFAENIQEDTFTPSFTGQKPVSEFDNELKNLNGVRCARCNQRMLSEEKYHNLLDNISQVKTGAELEKLISDNKQYLNESNSIILKDLKEINAKYPDADIKTILQKIDKNAPKIYEETCKNNINLIKLVTEFPSKVGAEFIYWFTCSDDMIDGKSKQKAGHIGRLYRHTCTRQHGILS